MDFVMKAPHLVTSSPCCLVFFTSFPLTYPVSLCDSAVAATMPEQDERSPLLQFPGMAQSIANSELGDHHTQFCHLVGVRPVNHPHGDAHKPNPDSLYQRVVKRRRGQHCTYVLTATLVNTLLLSQIVLGASLTGLAASNSNRILITVFGALNTVIAGVIAFLKSRGQPVRARMFRDDLERVVDEIENSAVMWFGISRGVHGYEAIDTDDQVTVRGEVARLTRLYDKAVKTNTMNDPDMYSAGTSESYIAGLRKSGGGGGGGGAPPGFPAINTAVTAPGVPALPAPPAAAAGAADPDEGPASKAPESKPKEDAAPAEAPPKTDEPAKDKPEAAPEAKPEAAKLEEMTQVKPEEPKADDKGKDAAAPPKAAAAVAAAAIDPDESPASSAHPPKREDSKSSSRGSSPTLNQQSFTA